MISTMRGSLEFLVKVSLSFLSLSSYKKLVQGYSGDETEQENKESSCKSLKSPRAEKVDRPSGDNIHNTELAHLTHIRSVFSLFFFSSRFDTRTSTRLKITHSSVTVSLLSLQIAALYTLTHGLRELTRISLLNTGAVFIHLHTHVRAHTQSQASSSNYHYHYRLFQVIKHLSLLPSPGSITTSFLFHHGLAVLLNHFCT